MEKVTNLIPMGLFCAFIGKLIMVGVNPAECGVAPGLIALISLK